MDIPEVEWEMVWYLANRLSVCNRARAVKLRILHRIHITPHLRHKYNSAHSPLCPKCKSNIGNYINYVWNYHVIQTYWSRIVAQLNNILGLALDPDPLSLLLGFSCKLVSNKHKKHFFPVNFCCQEEFTNVVDQ